MKKNQQRIFSVLTSKKIQFEVVDISVSDADKALMRERAGNPTALPPQICNGEVYCGVSLTQKLAKVIIRRIDNVTPSQN